MNESQTRLEKIDPKLREAGWGVVADSRILTEQNAYTIAPGKVGTKDKKPKKVDYILMYRGVKLAVIEAKRDELPASEGVMKPRSTPVCCAFVSPMPPMAMISTPWIWLQNKKVTSPSSPTPRSFG